MARIPINSVVVSKARIGDPAAGKELLRELSCRVRFGQLDGSERILLAGMLERLAADDQLPARNAAMIHGATPLRGRPEGADHYGIVRALEEIAWSRRGSTRILAEDKRALMERSGISADTIKRAIRWYREGLEAVDE